MDNDFVVLDVSDENQNNDNDNDNDIEMDNIRMDNIRINNIRMEPIRMEPIRMEPIKPVDKQTNTYYRNDGRQKIKEDEQYGLKLYIGSNIMCFLCGMYAHFLIA